MKNILLLLIILLPFVSFSQSKNDLRAEIAQLKSDAEEDRKLILTAGEAITEYKKEIHDCNNSNGDNEFTIKQLEKENKELIQQNKVLNNKNVDLEVELNNIKIKEKAKKTTQSSIINKNIGKTINLKSYATVHKFPSEESLEMKNFEKNNIKIVGYANQMFKIKSSAGETGYIPYSDIGYDIAGKQKKVIDEKIIDFEKKKSKKIIIRGAGVSEINSANGVDFSIDWAYLDKTKDIKYIQFTVTPFNSVGDLQTCRIGGHSKFTGKVTGPIKASDKFDLSTWGTAWYNSTISCIKINKVQVFYLDGSSYTYIKELPEILESNYVNSCKY
jgi:cell division protein FtsB